jgi:hypothetical protein
MAHKSASGYSPGALMLRLFTFLQDKTLSYWLSLFSSTGKYPSPHVLLQNDVSCINAQSNLVCSASRCQLNIRNVLLFVFCIYLFKTSSAASTRNIKFEAPPPRTYSDCCHRKGKSFISGKSGRIKAVPETTPPGM